jgi:hypothetical protein
MQKKAMVIVSSGDSQSGLRWESGALAGWLGGQANTVEQIGEQLFVLGTEEVLRGGLSYTKAFEEIVVNHRQGAEHAAHGGRQVGDAQVQT